jgi:hypothetical protein
MTSKLRSALSIVGICGVALAAPVAMPAESPLYVGVLEDITPGHLSPAMTGPHVRLAFAKQGASWAPFRTNIDTQEDLAGAGKSYPTGVTWTVVFDGRSLGAITSGSARRFDYYGDIGTLNITTPPASIPHIDSGADAFRYIDRPAQTRPLVLVSAANYRDPEHWKPTQLTAAERPAAIRAFRAQVPSSEQCDAPEQGPVHKISYQDHQVALLKAYRSRTGEVLFGEQLNDKRSNCDFFDDKTFFDYWFVMDAQQHIRLLGSGMAPMDAADLDADGRSEWMFLTNRGEDENGYLLFYDDFGKSAYFRWTYH